MQICDDTCIWHPLFRLLAKYFFVFVLQLPVAAVLWKYKSNCDPCVRTRPTSPFGSRSDDLTLLKVTLLATEDRALSRHPIGI
jgi:hypothetical protein